jgi:hypothetical protein
MKRFSVLLPLSTIMFLPASALAWNSFGHMSVAYIAYNKLTPQTRDKADALLAKNPDFQNWMAMVPAGISAADTNLMVFMIASTWADRIKNAPGFSEDDPTDRNKCGVVSLQNTGFADHFRHRCWHFIDVAFTQDGTTPLPVTPTPNAQERVDLFRPVLGSNDDDLKSYDLSWLLHLVGDLHQPLHCTTRVGSTQLDGDAGGNFVNLNLGNSTVKLHAFWDDLLGPTSAKPEVVIQTAKQLPAADAIKASDLNVSHWVDEGVQNAKDSVYVAPVGLGAGPFTITNEYQKAAKALAKKQVALAGARLANLLNAELK